MEENTVNTVETTEKAAKADQKTAKKEKKPSSSRNTDKKVMERNRQRIFRGFTALFSVIFSRICPKETLPEQRRTRALVSAAST